MFAKRPGWYTRLIPRAVVQCRSRSRVLLTFDDGPHPVHTPVVLAKLHEHDLKAVFFLVGNRVERAPHVVKQIVEAGHAIGNHTYSHTRWPMLAGHQIWRDIATCQRVVTEIGGVRPTVFRPPFGRLTPGILASAWSQRMHVMNWSLDSGDWQCRSEADAETCATEVIERIQPDDIVLLHDDHEYTARILDRVLREIKRRKPVSGSDW